MAIIHPLDEADEFWMLMIDGSLLDRRFDSPISAVAYAQELASGSFEGEVYVMESTHLVERGDPHDTE